MKDWKVLIEIDNEAMEVNIRALNSSAARYGIQIKYSNCKILSIEEKPG